MLYVIWEATLDLIEPAVRSDQVIDTAFVLTHGVIDPLFPRLKVLSLPLDTARLVPDLVDDVPEAARCLNDALKPTLCYCVTRFDAAVILTLYVACLVPR